MISKITDQIKQILKLKIGYEPSVEIRKSTQEDTYYIVLDSSKSNEDTKCYFYFLQEAGLQGKYFDSFVDSDIFFHDPYFKSVSPALIYIEQSLSILSQNLKNYLDNNLKEFQVAQELFTDTKKDEDRKKFLEALSEIDPDKLLSSKISVDLLQEELDFEKNPTLWQMATQGLPIVVDWYWHASIDMKEGPYPINTREVFLGYLKASIMRQEEVLIQERGIKNIPRNLKSVMLNFLINFAEAMVQNKVETVQVDSGPSWSNRFFANPTDEKKSNFLNMIRSHLTDFIINEDGCWRFLDNRLRNTLSSIMTVELTRYNEGKKTTIDDFAEMLFNDPRGPLTEYLRQRHYKNISLFPPSMDIQ